MRTRLASALILVCACTGVTGKDLPHDRWDWGPKAGESVKQLNVYGLSNGDALIAVGDGRGHVRYETFFSRVAVADSFNKERPLQTQQMTLDGQTVTILSEGTSLKPVPLLDGTVVRPASMVVRDCFRGPVRNVFIRWEYAPAVGRPRPKEVSRKVLFYLLPEPEKWTAGTNDCDEEQTQLEIGVEALYGQVLALNDGTFLVAVPERGFIIRFDANFISQSHLINDRIFVFDVSPIDSMFIDKITHKQYSSNQEALTDLRRYLESERSKRTR